MSDRIKLLPEVVANQIAAGEVVADPSSVVKELVENAIDAGATTVKVNYRGSGEELVQVVDDGCGMSPTDARLAFDRHATSKIRSVEDIYALHTFGFRGEALASIAAVAEVELRTRQAEDELGTLVEICGGELKRQEVVACPKGTQFSVRNLFYNVPERRRFAKKPATLARQIRQEFQRVALCHPEISFELYANEAPVYRLPVSSLAGRIVDLVGRQIKQNLLEVDASTSIASLRGYIGRPSAAKQHNSDQFLFVNGRYFKSPYLVSALMRGYEKLIPQSTQPAFFLFLEIDPSRIDVNILPKKTEVRFDDEEAVWQIVHAAVRETLAKSGSVPMMDFDAEQNVEIPILQRGAVYGEPEAVSREDYNPFAEGYIDPSAPDPNLDYRGFDVPFTGPLKGVSDTSVRPRSSSRTFVPQLPTEEWEEFSSEGNEIAASEEFSTIEMTSFDEEESRIEFGAEEPQEQQLDLPTELKFERPMAVGGAMAVALMNGRMVVVDLRRARERVLYDRYLKRLSGSSAVSQQLLFAEQLTLSKEEFALMMEHEVEFASLGFDIRFGQGEQLEVQGIPAELTLEELEGVIYELIKLFAERGLTEELLHRRAASLMARSGARRMAAVPAEEEVAALLEALAQTPEYSFTADGKAVFVPLTVEELRHKLG